MLVLNNAPGFATGFATASLSLASICLAGLGSSVSVQTAQSVDHGYLTAALSFVCAPRWRFSYVCMHSREIRRNKTSSRQPDWLGSKARKSE